MCLHVVVVECLKACLMLVVCVAVYCIFVVFQGLRGMVPGCLVCVVFGECLVCHVTAAVCDGVLLRVANQCH